MIRNREGEKDRWVRGGTGRIEEMQAPWSSQCVMQVSVKICCLDGLSERFCDHKERSVDAFSCGNQMTGKWKILIKLINMPQMNHLISKKCSKALITFAPRIQPDHDLCDSLVSHKAL